MNEALANRDAAVDSAIIDHALRPDAERENAVAFIDAALKAYGWRAAGSAGHEVVLLLERARALASVVA
jgi:hypothetical protein